jgi:hypothetical protein
MTPDLSLAGVPDAVENDRLSEPALWRRLAAEAGSFSLFFISHSSRDRAAAERVRDRLRAQGYASLFLDFDPDEGIPAGRSWEEELYAQLRRSDALIFIGSEASLESRWCFAELALARANGKPIFPVAVEPAARHPLLESTQWIDLAAEGETVFARLWSGLKRHGFDPDDAFAWDAGRPPYPGLSPFQAEDAAVFFGRDEKIDELLSRLQPTLAGSSRFIAVIGPSGSGKSSLVRAGLIPRLERRRERWVVVPPFTPGDRPLSQLARRLAAALGNQGWRLLFERIERDPRQLVELAEDLMARRDVDAGSVLLIVDQAEELVTQAGEEERGSFLRLVAGALEGVTPLRVVATLRSEFVTTSLREPTVADAIGTAVVLGPLDRARLPEVIEGPARRAGVELDPGLAGRMVEETRGGDALPLLAYTLRQLYDRAGPKRHITAKDYEAIGGVLGALRGRADQIAEELETAGKGNLVIPTLMKLASVGSQGEPIRRRILRKDLSAAENEVVQAFVDARLAKSESAADDAAVEVAHEALLRAWAPLRQAIEASQDALRLRSELEHLAWEWDAAGRPSSYLLRDERLAGGLSFLHSQIGREVVPLVREFVQCSYEGSEAALRRESELLASRVLETLQQDPERAILLALAALEQYAPSPRVVLALSTALIASKARSCLRGHAGAVVSAACCPNGSRILTASGDGTARIWDAAAAEQLEVLRGHCGRGVERRLLPRRQPDGYRLRGRDRPHLGCRHCRAAGGAGRPRSRGEECRLLPRRRPNRHRLA